MQFGSKNQLVHWQFLMICSSTVAGLGALFWPLILSEDHWAAAAKIVKMYILPRRYLRRVSKLSIIDLVRWGISDIRSICQEDRNLPQPHPLP